jgi:hypothetical protein
MTLPIIGPRKVHLTRTAGACMMKIGPRRFQRALDL